MAENTDRWEYLIRLLRALADGDNTTVATFSHELDKRPVVADDTIVKEPQSTYEIPTRAGEKVVCTDEETHQIVSQLVTSDELLNFLASGPPGFLPGELERLMADIDHARERDALSPARIHRLRPSLGCTD